MRSFTASELLQVWERGKAQPSYQKALLLLTTACPDLQPEELAKLSIGRRDARLLTFRERIFGPCLVGMTPCPACDDWLEFTFNVADIRRGTEDEPDSPMSLSIEGYEVTFRLPDSDDLAALAGKRNVEEGRTLLFERCLVEVRHHGEDHTLEQLPVWLVEAITEQMALADPQADIQLGLECPTCGHSWAAPFDIVTYLWREIETWAQRTVREVHRLALAYSWGETEILAMSALRRQCYLELIEG
jgi:hypothetical protein